MRISDWSSDVCSSDLIPDTQNYIDFSHQREAGFPIDAKEIFFDQMEYIARNARSAGGDIVFATAVGDIWQHGSKPIDAKHAAMRSEEHTSELQSLMRISYAVFCLKKKNKIKSTQN